MKGLIVTLIATILLIYVLTCHSPELKELIESLLTTIKPHSHTQLSPNIHHQQTSRTTSQTPPANETIPLQNTFIPLTPPLQPVPVLTINTNTTLTPTPATPAPTQTPETPTTPTPARTPIPLKKPTPPLVQIPTVKPPKITPPTPPKPPELP